MKISREKVYPAPYYPGLGCSRSGKVFRRTGEVWVEIDLNQKGDYLQISHGGGMVCVHHVVLSTFKGPRPPGKLALHKNDCRHDNSRANLYWGTPADNARDRIRNGGSRNKPGDPVDDGRKRRAAKELGRNAKPGAEGRSTPGQDKPAKNATAKRKPRKK